LIQWIGSDFKPLVGDYLEDHLVGFKHKLQILGSW